MTWDPAKIEDLKTLWAEGLSCSQIARALGGGLTRNAVIGKVTRLGLEPRGSNHKSPHPRAPTIRALRPSRPLPPPPPESPPPLGEIEQSSPPGTCQWIHGDVAEHGWRMCGHPPARPGSPWCAFHFAKARAKA